MNDAIIDLYLMTLLLSLIILAGGDNKKSPPIDRKAIRTKLVISCHPPGLFNPVSFHEENKQQQRRSDTTDDAKIAFV